MPRPQIPPSAKDYSPADSADRKGMFPYLCLRSYQASDADPSGMGDLFGPAPEPQTELARYRILAPRAGGECGLYSQATPLYCF